MRKMRNIRKGYVDGVITVYKAGEENRSSFNAVTNALSVDDLKKVVTLRYNVETKRATDIDFAESHDRTLSLKVSTPLNKNVEALHYAVTQGVLYTIYLADYDEHEDRMYLYLMKERELSDE